MNQPDVLRKGTIICIGKQNHLTSWAIGIYMEIEKDIHLDHTYDIRGLILYSPNDAKRVGEYVYHTFNPRTDDLLFVPGLEAGTNEQFLVLLKDDYLEKETIPTTHSKNNRTEDDYLPF